ncbi:fumarylacetoacetate hydrolase family protein [Actinomyces sp. B33]|uniref:fumarylacetoacetate hydrolase family protein n=1 Tax=Actinomyces sp. B33 TaxID=2942131 RepID=UPI00233FB590|nr:fumarylacetoacetate hydrolase family protein [Actinomyces sp. B33]MDC4232765.1 fumarylacetoacetate hydrolase family protein [Actinomyces sp. B33]
MRIVRFSDGDSPRYGVLEDDSTRIVVLKGDPLFAPIEPDGRIVELDEVRLLSPVIPRSKVVGLAGTYGDAQRWRDDGTLIPPGLFLKPNTSVIGPDDPVVNPAWARDVLHEGELAVVIKTLAKDVPADRADEVILGYTCADDVTASGSMSPGAPWSTAKGFDTACPLGPWIVVDPGLDVSNLTVTTSVDGRVCGRGSTADLNMSVAQIVSYASSVFTLLPGDVIITGAPAATGAVEAGRLVEVEIEGIGTLSTPVRSS